MEIFTFLENHYQYKAKEIAKIRIQNKYRNVFHLDDPFCNQEIDKQFLLLGELDHLSSRIKEDYNLFVQEELNKIAVKIVYFLDNLLEDKKEE